MKNVTHDSRKPLARRWHLEDDLMRDFTINTLALYPAPVGELRIILMGCVI